MASKTPVLTSKAPPPLPGIMSQAIVCNGMVYCSGAVAMDPVTGKLVDGDVKAHTVLNPPMHFEFAICMGMTKLGSHSP